MRRTSLLAAAAAVVLAGGAGHVARAALVPVANSDFENPALTGTPEQFTTQVITNWTGAVTPSTSGSNYGVQFPATNRYASNNPLPAPANGKQFAFANDGVGETTTITSDSLGTVAANTAYTLTVAIGNGLNIDGDDVTIELLAGGTPVATATLPNSSTVVPNGGFQDLTTAAFTSPLTGGTIGSPLTVRLTQVNNSITGTAQAHFDNVRVDATTVPEPAAAGLAACGAAGLLVRRRRRAATAR